MSLEEPAEGPKLASRPGHASGHLLHLIFQGIQGPPDNRAAVVWSTVGRQAGGAPGARAPPVFTTPPLSLGTVDLTLSLFLFSTNILPFFPAFVQNGKA